MISKALKSFLSVVENPKSLPSFIGLYLFTWLLWHNQLFVEFFHALGTITERLTTAIDAVTSFQHLTVFWLTIALFILRIGFDALVSSSRKYIDKKEQENNQDTLQHNNDVERLLTTLDETREQLKTAKEREKQLKKINSGNVNKLLKIQAQLDEVNADRQLLMQTNERLQAQQGIN